MKPDKEERRRDKMKLEQQKKKKNFAYLFICQKKHLLKYVEVENKKIQKCTFFLKNIH